MTGKILTALEDRRLELGPDGKSEKQGEHWRLSRDGKNVAWLIFDLAGASANTLSDDGMSEFNDMLAHLEENPPKGLVIRSAKKSGFIAGADVRDFRGAVDEDAVRERMTRANAITDRLAALKFPTIAVVHGYCLGGGFEVALACDYRLAIDGATFGFPEILLGLHPGLGGTVRLTQLIDPVEAMTMMLTGKTVHTGKAKKLGIADAVIEERHVNNAVAAAIAGKIKKPEHDLKDAALATGPGRAFAARQMESKAADRAPREHYPAPYALIRLWREHGGDVGAMKKAEIDSFAKLMVSDTAQNLIRVYFLREKLKNLAGKSESSINHVHVIGAGAMGGDIAGWCAIKGYTVTLGDVALKPIAGAVKRTAKLCEARHLSSIETRDALDRLIPDPEGAGAARADLIIEAAPEKLDLKRKIYGDLEAKMKDGAILATNTSSIPLEKLAAELTDPARFVGLHFFNPASRMDVIEIVHHDNTSDETLETVRKFTGAIDKLPAPVASAPGFLVNRALMPYLMEALVMIDEGVDKVTIDKAAEKFGMPMGPVELADQVGLDICLDVAEMLQSSLDTPMAEIPDWFRKKVENGDLGRKTGKGLYEWKDGNAHKASDGEIQDGMIDRLILPLTNACVSCLRTGVIEDHDILDGAIIFGTGFAPFRGGPMHYAKTRGIEEIIGAQEKLAENHGPRFTPDAGWRDLA